MSKHLVASLALLAVLSLISMSIAEVPRSQVVLCIHGGTAGPKQEMTPELEKALRAGLDRALAAGFEKLQAPGGTSLDAVEAAIRTLEDSPHFNAGKGAVFTHDGRNELDASIMEGKTKRAGAVAGVATIKNPITAARAVMEKSKHVLLTGRGADEFAKQLGLEIVDPSYFWTEERWHQIQETWKKEGHKPSDATKTSGADEPVPPWGTQHLGTVGAVAVDRNGNLAAGTSTGGMNNKMSGRVGDSPIIGAGTYAENEACAVSATGHGEYFIRYVVGHDIAALVKYKGLSVEAAADEVVLRKLKAAGGEGGVIVLDAKGNFAMPYNSHGLYRGYVTAGGERKVLLYSE